MLNHRAESGPKVCPENWGADVLSQKSLLEIMQEMTSLHKIGTSSYSHGSGKPQRFYVHVFKPDLPRPEKVVPSLSQPARLMLLYRRRVMLFKVGHR